MKATVYFYDKYGAQGTSIAGLLWPLSFVLFYFVSIYRYFEEESSYNKLLGYSTSINILAGLAGTIFASYLVFKSSWRTGLLIDAITFLLIGFVILFFGRDVVPSTKVEKKVNIEPQEHNIEKTLSLMF